MIAKYARFVLKHRALAILFVFIVTAALWYPLIKKKLKTGKPSIIVETSVERMTLEDDEALAHYKEFAEEFGSEEYIFIVFKTDHMFEPETLQMIDRITRWLEDFEYEYRDDEGKWRKRKIVDYVLSITNAKRMVGSEGMLEILPVMPEIPKTKEEALAAKKLLLENPFYVDNIISADGKTAGIVAYLVNIPNDQFYRRVLVESAREYLAEEKSKLPYPIDGFYLGGIPVLKTDLVDMERSDSRVFTVVSVALIVVVLFLFFRNLQGIYLPLITVAFAEAWTLALMSYIGATLNVVTSMLTPLLLVLGVALVIHVLSQYYEESVKSPDKLTATRRMVVHLFWPCFLTSFTTAIGFSSLCISKVVPVREFGILSAFGVLMVFVIGMSFDPALLSYLPRPSERKKKAYDTGLLAKILRWISGVDRKRPGLIMAIGLAALLWGVIGIFRIKVETHLLKFFKESHPIRQSFAFIDENLGGINPMEVAIEGEPGSMKRADVLKAIDRLAQFFSEQPELGKVVSVADFIKDLNRAMHGGNPAFYKIPDTDAEVAQLLLLYEMTDQTYGLDKYVNFDYSRARLIGRIRQIGSGELVKLLKRTDEFVKGAFPKDIRVRTTGSAILYSNLVNRLVSSLIKSFGLAVFLIWMVMSILFRSVRTGLVSMIPNVSPIVITLGAMGWFGIELNIATAMIASVAIGIAVDDTIHFISRLRREFGKDHDYRAASHRAITSVGRAIVSTSVVISAGFGVLLLSNFLPTIYFGLLTGITMITALLGVLFMLPSCLILLKPPIKEWKPEE